MTLPQGPLAGIRVIDFTWAAMGPYAGYLLAGLGAEVIHVSRPNARSSASATASLYHELNVGKINVGIDLKSEAGRDLMFRLVAGSDVFIENFRPGVVEKLGLGHADIRAKNPRLVMASGSALGRAGVAGQYVGYAPIFSAVSGLADLTGYADGPPVEIRHPVDLTGGAVIAFSVLAALGRRRVTGRGCYVDLGARDAILWTLTEPLVRSQKTPESCARIGNAHPDHAPHGVYRCAGENAWMSLAIETNAEWRTFCGAIGQTALAADTRFARAADRVRNRETIDATVTAWTESRPVEVAVGTLQRAGIAALPSLNGAKVFTDPHLTQRNAFDSELTGGRQSWFATAPWVFGDASRALPVTVTGTAAVEHTFLGILGLSLSEIETLTAEGVIG